MDVGCTVRFKALSALAVTLRREGQTGTVTAVHDYPGQGGRTVDISFGTNDIEPGIRIHELELVAPSPKLKISTQLTSDEEKTLRDRFLPRQPSGR